MEIELQTPALFFPAISLLMLAYTNRFLALAALIRNLHAAYRSAPDDGLLQQIHNLRKRVFLVRNMQLLGVTAILLCVLTMFLIYVRQDVVAHWIFGAAMVALVASLLFSLREIMISVNALNLQLSDLECGDPKLPPLTGEETHRLLGRGERI